MKSDLKHLKITVSGKVQGVFYRLSTKAVADQLGVRGMVANQSDGPVYIEAEGDEFAMDSFLDWCQEGPDRAEVENVSTEVGDMKNYRNFEVVKSKK